MCLSKQKCTFKIRNPFNTSRLITVHVIDIQLATGDIDGTLDRGATSRSSPAIDIFQFIEKADLKA